MAKKVDVVNITTHDGPLTLPEGMTLSRAIKTLEQERTHRETVMGLNATIEGFLPDVAHAFFQVLKARYGWVHNKPTPGFFGPTPPTMLTVPVGLNEHVEVPWGRTVVPGIDGFLEPGVSPGPGNRLVFTLGGEVKRKYEPTVMEIVAEVKTYLREHSVFRGQAFRLTFVDPYSGEQKPIPEPIFLDINRDLKDRLVFNDDVMYSIQTSVFTPISHTETVRKVGVAAKRGILLSGRFGTGKSMTSTVVADLCTANGWTFILCERADELADILRLAREYPPAVVFCEDIDRVMTGDRDMSIDEVLNVIDGVESKNAELMVILTTNNVDNITQAMLRPGRLDAVIEVHPPDAKSVERLLRQYSTGLIAEDEDIEAAAASLAGQIPAVIEEVVKRAKMGAIYRGVTEFGPGSITGADLDAAAATMHNEMRLLELRVPDVRSDREKAAQVLADGTVKAAQVSAILSNGRAPEDSPLDQIEAGSK